jgi:hypothetical protein
VTIAGTLAVVFVEANAGTRVAMSRIYKTKGHSMSTTMCISIVTMPPHLTWHVWDVG